MNIFKQKLKKNILAAITLLLLLMSTLMIPLFLKTKGFTDNSINYKTLGDLNTSAQISNSTQWLNNPNFTTTDSWYSTKDGTDPQDLDLNLDTTLEQANYTIIGDSYTYSEISGLPTTAGGWSKTTNPYYPNEPNQIATLNSEGLYARHYWEETADQQVAVQYDKIIEMPFSMLDYDVTSASLSITVNGTVQAYHGANGAASGEHGVEVEGDFTTDSGTYTGGSPQYNIGDFARFYVHIADQDKTKTYLDVISYQNSTLGQDSAGVGYDYMYDYIVEVGDENDLIFLLNNLFHNYNDYNLTITIGIMINCEDNFWSDEDYFEAIIINSCDFSFTCEKTVDQLSTMSWNQDTIKPNDLSPNPIQVTDAVLNFKYKVDKNWTQTTTSLNSRFEIEINGNRLGETIALAGANTSFQEAKSGGLDVKALIDEDKEINLTIKILIADEFNLEENITVSIDEVELWISYIETVPDQGTELDLIVNNDNITLPKETEAIMGQMINITGIYKNLTSDYITGATLRLTGEGLNQTLSPDAFNRYYIEIPTYQIGYGDNYFKLAASKDTYETQEISFKITVVDRYAYINTVYLNGTDKTSTKTIDNLPSGDPLNITIGYVDDIGSPIEDATVQLKNGTQIIGDFSEDDIIHTYNYTYDTTGLIKGVYYFSVVALKENCTTSSVQLTIVIDLKGSATILYLNGTIRDDISATVGEIILVNLTYQDSDGNPIPGATVTINGSGISAIMNPYGGNNYSVSIDTDDLSGSTNRLDIYAEKAGYVAQPVTLIIRIGERQSNLTLFLNGNEKEIPANHIFVFGPIEIDETLNISVDYCDYYTGELIDPADVNITGGVSYTDNLESDGNIYTLIFWSNSSGLLWGLNFLTIQASRTGYLTQSFTIQINIISKPTDLELYLNDVQFLTNETAEIELPFGSLLNVTVRYLTNDTKSYINGTTEMTWRVNGSDITQILDDTNIGYQDYILDTTSLGFGRKILYLSASETNYQPFNMEIKLYVLQRQVEIVPEGGETIQLVTGENIVIRVYINDTDFGLPITGAEVKYTSSIGSGLLLDDDNDGIYEATLGAFPEGLYTFYITVFKDENYEFATKTVYVNIRTSANDAFLIFIIQVLAAVGIIGAIAFSSYIYAYQKVLKFPKPVRKVRKFKSKLRKKRSVSVDIVPREKAFEESYKEKWGVASKSLKGKVDISNPDQYLPTSKNIKGDSKITKD